MVYLAYIFRYLYPGSSLPDIPLYSFSPYPLDLAGALRPVP